MQLTRAADYAVRVMIHLAGMPPGAHPSHGELAEAVECPRQFLSKVLQRLTRAGLIVSHRGKSGGFELPGRGRRASMLDVVEAIEGPLSLNLCLDPAQLCGRQDWCPAHLVWAQGQAALTHVLKSAIIDDLARQTAVASDAIARLGEVPIWS